MGSLQIPVHFVASTGRAHAVDTRPHRGGYSNSRLGAATQRAELPTSFAERNPTFLVRRVAVRKMVQIPIRLVPPSDLQGICLET